MAPKKNYTPQQMAQAIQAVQKGEKVAKAAENFGVPRVTLHNKVTGKSPLECSMGPSTCLTKDEEHILELWVIMMSEKHIPITKDELLDSVQRIITDKRQETPFVNNRPGKKWYNLFLKRHPLIAERTAQALTTARDNVTEQDIERWFKEIEDYLQEKKLKSVLEEPDRIFNTDESAFYLSPKPGKVLAKRGEKHVYSSSGDEKDNLTVLITGSAAGTLAPPMVVYNYERIPAAVARKCPDNFGIGRSQTGLMCGPTFYEYMTNVFYPWLVEKKIKTPILFFLDGHKSHLTLHLSEFCAENGIELISLYPNSTHLLQPMDLSVFRPLKLLWKKTVTKWKINNLGQKLKKEDFAPLLQEALQSITEESIRNGFRAGGLHPFGASYVDMTKIKSGPEKTQNQESQIQFLSILEKEIKNKFTAEKLQHFKDLFYKPRNELNDLLHIEDTSLYLIWASTKHAVGCYQIEGNDRPNTYSAPEEPSPSTPVDEIDQFETTIAEQSRPSTPKDLMVPENETDQSKATMARPSTSKDLMVSENETDQPNATTTRPGTPKDLIVPENETNQPNATMTCPSSPSTPDDLMVPENETDQPNATTTCTSTPKDVMVPENKTDQPKATMAHPSTPKVLIVPENQTDQPKATMARPSTSKDLMVPENETDQPNATMTRPSSPSTPDDLMVPENETDQPNATITCPSTPKNLMLPENVTKQPKATMANQSRPSKSVTTSKFATRVRMPEHKKDELPQPNHNLQKTPIKTAETHTNTTKSPMKIKGYIVPSPFKRNLPWPEEDDGNKGKRRRFKEKLPFSVTSQLWRDYHRKKETEKQHALKEKERKAEERAQKKKLKEKLLQEKKKTNLKRKVIDDDTSSEETETEIQYCESDNSPYETEQEEVYSYETEKKKKLIKSVKEKKGKSGIKSMTLKDSDSEDDMPLGNLSKSNRLSKGSYVVVRYEGEYFPGVIENTSNKTFEISTMTFSTANTFKWPEKPDKIWYREEDIVDFIDPPVLTNKRGFYTMKEMAKYLPFTV